MVTVGSLLRRGGEECAYRLAVSRREPSVQIKASAHSFTFEPGKTNELKMTVKLENGAKGKWTASLTGLPAEWGVASQDVPEKGGELTWKVPLPAAAESFSGPFQVILQESDAGGSHGPTHRATHDLIVTGENNGVPNGYNHLVIESIDSLWMTVKKAKPPAEKK